MICYCEGQDNGHDFILISDESGTKTFECQICHRQITESINQEQ